MRILSLLLISYLCDICSRNCSAKLKAEETGQEIAPVFYANCALNFPVSFSVSTCLQIQESTCKSDSFGVVQSILAPLAAWLYGW